MSEDVSLLNRRSEKAKTIYSAFILESKMMHDAQYLVYVHNTSLNNDEARFATIFYIFNQIGLLSKVFTQNSYLFLTKPHETV